MSHRDEWDSRQRQIESNLRKAIICLSIAVACIAIAIIINALHLAGVIS